MVASKSHLTSKLTGHVTLARFRFAPHYSKHYLARYLGVSFKGAPLILVAVSQDIPLSHYNSVLFSACVITAVSLITFLFYAKYPLKKSFILSSIIFCALYSLAYSKVDKFFEAELNDNFLTLKYASPSNNKLITINEIESVTFGSKSRGFPACFIVFHLKTGDDYQSTFLDSDISYCKTKRNEINALLNI